MGKEWTNLNGKVVIVTGGSMGIGSHNGDAVEKSCKGRCC